MRRVKGKAGTKRAGRAAIRGPGKAKPKRYVLSKWRKTNALLRKPEMREFIPETRKLTYESLRELLDKYKMVYIKPDIGTYGNGVMRAEAVTDEESNEEIYIYQSGLDKQEFMSFDELYDAIQTRTKNRLYLVQKGINLTQYKNNRFDIRVMVQQTPNKKWETTGVIGRVGDPNKVVTNVHNGGKLQPVETLLTEYLSGKSKSQYIESLNNLGLQTARQLHSRFKGLKEIGLDVALDEQLRPWVLEVNTCPDPYIFSKLKDKRVFRKIRRYAKANGRIR